MIDSTELIQACLDATDEEHSWEVAAEHWHTELGERPATHIASDSERDMTGFFVAVVWAYLHRTGRWRTG